MKHLRFILATLLAVICTTTGMAQEPYAVVNNDHTTLTFYYDDQKSTRSGTKYDIPWNYAPGWTEDYGAWITTATFDKSFADYQDMVDLRQMFYFMDALTEINHLDYLNTSKVSTMNSMFMGCSSLTTLDLSNFEVGNLVKLGLGSMFNGCESLKTIYCNSDWSQSAANGNNMFSGCKSLVGENGTTVSSTNVTCARPDTYGTPGYFTRKPYAVLDNGTLTFYNDGKNKEKAGTVYFLNKDNNYPGWHNSTTKPYLTVTKAVFDPSFATARPTTTYRWFCGMNNLTKIEGMEYLNTSEVTNMAVMFTSLSKLESLDLSHLNTEKVTTMSSMFAYCYNLALDLSHFNTANVENMYQMFLYCSLETLDLTNFDTKNVKNMHQMFSRSTLKTILVGNNWSTENVTDSEDMFANCSTNLTGGAGTKWRSTNPTDKTYARIDDPTHSKPGYFTDGAREEYGVWNSTTKTLTHYYDWKKSQRASEGVVIDGQMYDTRDEQDYPMSFDEVLKVVYDPSVAKVPYKYFYGGWFCGGLVNMTTIEGLEYIDTSNEHYFSDMFYGCESLTSLDLSTFDTRKATNMSSMFRGCASLTNLILGENFSTANVTSMAEMFAAGCNPDVIATVINHEGFSTANVTNMSYMFNGFTRSDILNLSKFNTAKVTNMTSMFDGCSSLTTIFVGPDWTTAAVTSSNYMFRGCTNLVGGAGTAYNSNNVTAGYAHIDGGTVNPGYLSAIAYTPYVVFDETTGTLSFYADNKQDEKEGTMYSLPTPQTSPDWMTDHENLRKVVFDPSFITARPTSLYYWFANQNNLEEIEGIENLVTSEVTDMESLFQGCMSLTTLDLTFFDTHQVTNMDYMFWECQHLQTIYVGSGWTTANVNSGVGMFNKCFSLEGSAGTRYDQDTHGGEVEVRQFAHVDGGLGNPGLLSGKTEAYVQKSTDYKTITFYYDAMRFVRSGETFDMNTSTNRPGWDEYRPTYVTTVIFDPSFANARPTSTNQWFYNMTNLTAIEGLEYLNTSEVTTMSRMFYACQKLTSLDLSHFDTQKVTDMGSMFRGCTALKDLDLSSFNTNRRLSFNWMFGGCTSLEVLDLSSFNTSAVYNMANMFNGCSTLKTIYVGDEWNAQGVSSSTQMFTGCTNIVGGAGTTYDSGHVDKTYARVDGGTSAPGYFSLKPDYLRGDVNEDGSVNIVDVTTLVNIILGKTSAPASGVADVNGDGSVNIVDVTTLVNIILGKD